VSAARARILAARHPQSAEVLELLAAAWDWMGESRPALEQVQPLAEKLCSAMRDRAPEPLRDAVPDAEAYLNRPDPYAPSSFFARIVLEAWARHAPLETPDSGPSECPRCGHAPQLGVLRPSGNGDALFLSCSLCRHEWPYRRTTCPECGEADPEKISFHQAEGWPQAQTQTCSSCQAYLHLLMPEKDLGMVPAIDELALLPLDVWATEQGFHKVWPNLAGL
jgi:pimeloyl-ACP methyl ester carboxylesterase